ncbi:GCN5-related N-acetyltransferase, partial [mine drainage metagenome]
MDDSSFRTPLTLVGRYVELVPLSVDHAEELWRALRDPEVSRWLRRPLGRTLDEVAASIRTLHAEAAAGRRLPVAIRLRAGGRVVGTTGFGPFDRRSGVVEIGG